MTAPRGTVVVMAGAWSVLGGIGGLAAAFAASGRLRERRIARARARHGELFEQVLDVLRRHYVVPGWLSNAEYDADEFAGQAASALRDLPEARSVEDVRQTLLGAFLFGFGPVIDPDDLTAPAEEIWRLWTEHAGTAL